MSSADIEYPDDLVFVPALFRAQIPVFEDEAKYTDAFLQMFWDQAVAMAGSHSSCILYGAQRMLALNLLMAHIMYLLGLPSKRGVIKAPGQGGFVTSSSIDKISVSKAAPPSTDMFGWWLGQSPWGQQLLALLEMVSVGGTSAGGLPEGEGFRKWAGVF